MVKYVTRRNYPLSPGGDNIYEIETPKNYPSPLTKK